MPFAIHCLDKPDSGAVRMAARPDHLAYLVGFEDKIIFAGPLLADDHQAMIGSLLILDLPDRAAAEKFSAGDPDRDQSRAEAGQSGSGQAIAPVGHAC